MSGYTFSPNLGGFIEKEKENLGGENLEEEEEDLDEEQLLLDDDNADTTENPAQLN